MPEESKDAGSDGTRKPSPEFRVPAGPEIAIPPTREAMSWIRALANDWEDERSHSEAAK